MIEFREVTISDKEWVDELLRRSDYMGGGYCFGNIFIWQYGFEEKIARVDDFFVASMGYENPAFCFPAGSGDLRACIEKLMRHAEEIGVDFVLYGLTNETKAQLELLFPGEFSFEEDRDSFDYIYNVEDLATLKGKKYHSKRNHIARFKDNHEWSFEPITRENIAACMQMNRKWCELNDCETNSDLKKEACAVSLAFEHFFELDFVGGLIRADGQVVAYSIGERLNSNTFITHIEKAYADVQGAYPIINQEFTGYAAAEYQYINREEDMGAPGLRKAKLSYKPAILLEKYIARHTGGSNKPLHQAQSGCYHNDK